jgi:cobalt-zinc-cadmium efflux system outer membrane protein
MKRPLACRRTAFLVLLALGFSPAFAEPPALPPGASLESLLEHARRENPDYAATRFEADAAAERVYPAGALADPTLRTELQNVTNYGNDANANILPSRVGSTKYTLIQPVPFWGKRDLKREAAEADANQAKARSDASWAELSARIKTAYAQLYQAVRSEALTHEIVTLLKGLDKITRARYANGLIPQQDAIRVQLEQTSLQGELVAWETERHHMQSRLNALLRRPVHAPLADPQRLRPLPPPARLDYVALDERLRARNPLLFAEAARVTAAEKSRELTYRNRYPDFSFGVSPIQTRSRVNEWELMVEMNIPLQQESRRSQEREAQATLSAAQSRQQATQNQLLSDLAENLSALDSAQRIERLVRSSLLPQAQMTFEAALTAYENGKVDFATLLDAQRQIRKARLDELKAQTDAQVRLAEIERLLGEDL